MVRIWCLPVSFLDRQRLLGEHGELHVIWSVLLKKRRGIKAGFQNHPQTLRFDGEIMGMLIDRYEQQRDEFIKRVYNHGSPLESRVDLHGYIKRIPYIYSDEEYQKDLNILRERDGLMEGMEGWLVIE